MKRHHLAIAALAAAMAALLGLGPSGCIGLAGLEAHLPQGSYPRQLAQASYWTAVLWLGLSALLSGLRRKGLAALWREDLSFLALTWAAGLCLLLATNPLWAGHWPALRMLLPLGLLLLSARLLHMAVVQPAKQGRRTALRGPATLAWALVALLLGVEAVFMWVGRPHANDNTLASKRWFVRHWQVNALGYREDGRCLQPQVGRKVLWLLGDSFTAGHGVAEVGDRFSDRLQAWLGEGWEVHNHGENGAGQRRAIAQMQSCRARPDLVIQAVYLNDIEEALEGRSDWPYHRERLGRRPPWPISALHGSCFLNYLYSLLPATGQGHWAELQAAYGDTQALQFMEEGFAAIRDTALAHGARQYAVVLFPSMNDVEGSGFALGPLRAMLARQGIPCMDLAPIYLPYPARQLRVNSSDAHPGPLAHQLAARAIASYGLGMGWWAPGSPAVRK